jgi:hypothetical protein
VHCEAEVARKADADHWGESSEATDVSASPSLPAVAVQARIEDSKDLRTHQRTCRVGR